MILPSHVYPVADRHGKTRFRFRKYGLPQRYLPHPTSPGFMEEYDACLAQSPVIRSGNAPARMGPRRFSAYRGREVVYFITSGRGLVKIGTTINLSARLKKLQTGSGPKLRVMVCIDGGADLESEYHQRYASSRFRGEWFHLTDEIKSEIKRLRRITGCPTVDDHPRKVGQIALKNPEKTNV